MGLRIEAPKQDGNARFNTLKVNLQENLSATRGVVTDNDGNFYYGVAGAGGAGFPFSGSAQITGSLGITGSINIVDGGITGSLYGTSSWAISASYVANAPLATTASYVTSSNVHGPFGSNSILSASYSVSSSNSNTSSYSVYAETASFVTASSVFGPYGSNSIQSASYAVSTSYTEYAVTSSFAQTASYVLNAISASYSYTASSAVNSFNAVSSSYAFTASSAISASITDTAITASHALSLPSNINITASNITVTSNLVVNGTASFNYVEQITGSAVIVGQEYIILNTQIPTSRYAGLIVYDSGSNTTASIVWDSQNNHLVYQNASGAAYTGGGFLSGPRNTGSLGEETYPTLNRVVRGQGGDHLYDSNIIDDDTKVSIGINTEVTGSLIVSNGITGSLYGTSSWAINAISSSYPIAVTGSTLYSVNPAGGVNGNTDRNIFLGLGAGNLTSDSDNVSLGTYAGYASDGFYGVNIGHYAGYSSSIVGRGIFIGDKAGYFANTAYRSTFLGEEAGAYSIDSYSSIFIGDSTGRYSFNSNNSIFLGASAGAQATSSYSILLGYRSGFNAYGVNSIGNNNIIIGTNITLEPNRKDSINIGGLIFATGSYSNIGTDPYTGVTSGRVGINVANPQYTLDISGSLKATASVLFPGLTESPQNNVVLVDTTTGQLYYTASSTLVASSSISSSYAPNIYNSDGELTENRYMSGSAYNLMLDPSLTFNSSIVGYSRKTFYSNAFSTTTSSFATASVLISANTTQSGSLGGLYGLVNSIHVVAENQGNNTQGVAIGYQSNTQLTGVYTSSRMYVVGSRVLVSRFGVSSSLDQSNNANNYLAGQEIITTYNGFSGGVTSSYTGQHLGLSVVNTIVNGNIGDLYGVRVQNNISNFTTYTGSATNNYYGIRLQASIGTTSAAITSSIQNYYAAHISSISIGATGRVTNLYGVYAEDSRMTHYFNGNVGIKTTRPAYEIDVVGSTRTQTNSNFGILANPTGTPTATPLTTGGALADGTYYYSIVATDGYFNLTTGSAIATTTISGGGGSGSVQLSWTAVAGADYYIIYRGTTLGSYNASYLSAQVTNTFTDVGGASVGYGFPTNNGTTITQIASNGNLNVGSGVITFGNNVGAPLKTLEIRRATGFAVKTGIVIGSGNSSIASYNLGTNQIPFVFGEFNTLTSSRYFVIGDDNNFTAGTAPDIANSIFIGYQNTYTEGRNVTAIGRQHTINTSRVDNGCSITIGRANSLNHRSIVIGTQVESTADGQLIIGQNNISENLTIRDIYFGNGIRNKFTTVDSNFGNGVNVTINGSGPTASADLAGGSLILAGGKGTGAGTPGDLIFSTSTRLASGVTLQSLSQRVWVKGDTGNVGIGTSAPTEKLEINGSVYLNSDNSGFIIDAVGNKRVGFMKYFGREAGIWRTGSGQDFEIGRVLSGSLTSPNTLVTDLYIDGNGNVGINTTNPSLANLQVQGNVWALSYTGSLLGTASLSLTSSFVNPVGTNAFIQGGNSFGTQALLGTNDIQNLALETNGTVRMVISGSNGNIGIGSTAPATKLDVVGTTRITGATTILGATTISGSFTSTGTFSLQRLEPFGSAQRQIVITSAGINAANVSTANNIIVIGPFAGAALTSSGADSMIAIGSSAGGSITTGGSYSIYIGRSAGGGITTGNNNLVISSANQTGIPSNTNYAIHLVGGAGYELDDAASSLGTLISRYAFIGGGFSSANSINDFYFGSAPFSKYLNDLNFYSPARTGSADLQGSNFIINAGRGTGAGTPGDFIVSTSATGSSGVQNQTLVNRIWVKGNSGNVGIGTSSPRAKLEVSGDIFQVWADADRFVGQVYLDGSTYRNGVLTNSLTRTTQIEARAADGTAEITFFAGTSEAARIINNGNVGIGTTIPSHKLHVSGAARFTGDVSNNAIYISSGKRINFDNREVSIGEQTSASYEGVSIGSFTKANTGTVVLGKNYSSATYNKVFMVGWNPSEVSATSNNTLAIYGTNTSGIGIFGSTSNEFNSNEIAILATAVGAGIEGNVAIGRLAYASGSYAIALGPLAEAFQGEFVVGSRDKPVTNVYFGGGNQSISRGAGTGTAYTINGSGAYGTDFAGGNITIAGGKGTGAAAPGDIIFSTAIPTTSGTTLQSLTQRVWIKGNSGNVGIGISSPAYKLDINGSLRVTSSVLLPGLTTSPQSNVITIDTTTGQLYYTASSAIGGGGGSLSGGATNYIARWNSTTTLTTGSIFDNGTNVGIGTASPNSTLHVYGASNPLIRVQAGGGNYSYIQLDDASSNGYLIKNVTSNTANGALPGALYTYTDNNNAFQHIHSGNPLFTILSGGDVGIGTTSPTNVLHINKNQNTQTRLDISNTTSGSAAFVGIQLTSDTNSGNFSIFKYSTLHNPYKTILAKDTGIYNGTAGGDMSFLNDNPSGNIKLAAGGSSTVQLFVSASGNVGINTLTPTLAKLQVQGNVWAESYTGSLFGTASWAVSASWAPNTGGSSQWTSSGANIYFNVGNVGVGTNSPAYPFDVAGNTRLANSLAVGTVAPSGTTGRIDASNDIVAFSSSDIRFKTNLKTISNPLDKISKVSGYEFDWIPDQENHGHEGHDIGVIAQEVEEILPEIVTTRESGYKAVKYEKIVPLLIEAIKEQQKQIEELRYLLQNK